MGWQTGRGIFAPRYVLLPLDDFEITDMNTRPSGLIVLQN